jgi:hypothetical protein
VRQLTERLKHIMEKKKTHYRCIVPVSIEVACSLFKPAHAFEYLQCSEFFCYWKIYNACGVLSEFVQAVNAVFKTQFW